jgi:hypothetical protein
MRDHANSTTALKRLGDEFERCDCGLGDRQALARENSWPQTSTPSRRVHARA